MKARSGSSYQDCRHSRPGTSESSTAGRFSLIPTCWTSNGSFALPYTGYNVPHKYPRRLWKYAPGYAIWPKGRLIALKAEDKGEFATVQIVPPGRRLRINALTRRGGSILVEVAGPDGKPLPGRSFAEARRVIGDQHWAPLIWDGGQDLGFAENSSILLRFRMDQAQIYGLEFA